MESSQTKLNVTAYFFTLLGVTLPLVSIALSQIFLACAILAFGIERLSARRWKVPLPPVKLPLALFMAATLVALVFSPEPETGRAPINKFWLFIIIPLVVSLFDSQRIQQTYLLLFALGALSSLLVIGQFLLVWQINTETRLTGFMGHWMTLSGGLMLAFMTGAGVCLFARPKWPFLWLAGLTITGVALSLTLTRSVWIATLAGALLLLLMRRFGWKKLVAAVVAVSAVLLLAPGVLQRRIQSVWDTNDPSNYARIAIWKAGIQMVKEHPWLGVGPQRISKVFYEYHPYREDRRRPGFFPVHMHNNLLQFAAERGIPCALFWLWFILELAWDHWRRFRQTALGESAHCIAAIGFSAVVVLFLAGIFEFNFGDSEVLMVFLFLVSAPYAVTGAHLETLSATGVGPSLHVADPERLP
jgi:putative inorganic carbon (hco3(-)) transporter